MNKNINQYVMEQLGLENEEEFRVKSDGYKYKFTNCDLYSEELFHEWSWNRDEITKLICGNGDLVEIEKTPWKPEKGEKYYYLYTKEGFNTLIGYATVCGLSVETEKYKTGNCFKTEKEAEKNKEAYKDWINSEPITDWRV